MTDRESPDREPPDWALPSWDAIEGASSRGRPGTPNAGRSIRTGNTTSPAPLRILAVSDVTRAVKDAVRGDPHLQDVWVEGEVGRVTISSAGHGYFTLKDERSQLSCIWFRDDRMTSPFEPQAGLRIVAHGRIDIYDPGGIYQLYVAAIQPAGFGDLALRFEALKARLAAEGLFDRARKRSLPPRPAVIAVVTSPTGAVWHDVRTVLARRWPLTRVILSPCLVQGEGAPASVVRALGRVDRWADRFVADGRPLDAPAVTILARGGGSLEDLWSFNDEAVVRAVVGHRRPVVSGVGHETDVTLADFAADVRAATPSAAAELVVPDRTDQALGLAATAARLHGLANARLAAGAREIAGERRVLDRLHPAAQLAQARERVGTLLDRATAMVISRAGAAREADERLTGRLRPLMPALIARSGERVDRAAAILPMFVRRRIETARSNLATAGATLGALGPQATLERGYAIARRQSDGLIVRDPAEAPQGTPLQLRVARGSFEATSGDGRLPDLDPGER